MGLGVGPGQMFPTLEQQAPRTSPGTNSHWNGATVAAPARQLPDQAAVPDLSQSPSFFQQQPMSPPPNSLGQQMPAGSSNMTLAGGWPPEGGVNASPLATAPGAPVMNAGGTVPVEWPGPGPNTMGSYDDARRQVDQNLNQSMGAAWDSSPAQAIPSPAAGIPFQQPASPAQQMESWNRQPVAPQPYPGQVRAPAFQEPPALPVINPTTGRGVDSPAMRATSNRSAAVPLYRDGIVVPEQYDSGAR
jgi:hypothetical protein